MRKVKIEVNFEQLLFQATAAISDSYFRLPVYGLSDPIYRERVYCYELYHQLRKLWDDDQPYILCGEIDKSGHPEVDEQPKPDFLVHVPGRMDMNHTIMEVKSIAAWRGGIDKDLDTLTNFQKYMQYGNAVYLVFGQGNLNGIELAINKWCLSSGNDGASIVVWHHQRVRESAYKLQLSHNNSHHSPT